VFTACSLSEELFDTKVETAVSVVQSLMETPSIMSDFWFL
jgi:hypothetical protein